MYTPQKYFLSIFVKYIFAKVRQKMFLKNVPNVLLTKYYSGYQIEKNAMGGVRSTYGERRRVYRGWWGNLRERTTWKTQV
jgi:hypothetical protein